MAASFQNLMKNINLHFKKLNRFIFHILICLMVYHRPLKLCLFLHTFCFLECIISVDLLSNLTYIFYLLRLDFILPFHSVDTVSFVSLNIFNIAVWILSPGILVSGLPQKQFLLIEFFPLLMSQTFLFFCLSCNLMSKIAYFQQYNVSTLEVEFSSLLGSSYCWLFSDSSELSLQSFHSLLHTAIKVSAIEVVAWRAMKVCTEISLNNWNQEVSQSLKRFCVYLEMHSSTQPSSWKLLLNFYFLLI